MNPEQQRKFNTIFGGLFLGLGIVIWLLAIFFAVVPNQPAPTPVIGATSVDVPSCRTALSELGYTATATASDVIAYEALTADPKSQLERASVAVLVCKLPVKAFCMGDGCEKPGLSFTLRKQAETLRLAGPVVASESTVTPSTLSKDPTSKTGPVSVTKP